MTWDITVRLTDQAETELQETAVLTELSRTDVINRAIQVYRVVAEEVDIHRSDLMARRPDGQVFRFTGLESS